MNSGCLLNAIVPIITILQHRVVMKQLRFWYIKQLLIMENEISQSMNKKTDIGYVKGPNTSYYLYHCFAFENWTKRIRSKLRKVAIAWTAGVCSVIFQFYNALHTYHYCGQRCNTEKLLWNPWMLLWKFRSALISNNKKCTDIGSAFCRSVCTYGDAHWRSDCVTRIQRNK